MSKILEQTTQFNDQECLKQAIEEMGLTPIFDEAGNLVTMQGYAGETFQADLGIKQLDFIEKTNIHTYGDFGFRLQDDGAFKMIGDDMCMKGSQFGQFMDKFSVAYAERKYVKEMYSEGFALVGRVQNQDGGVDLQFMEIGLG